MCIILRILSTSKGVIFFQDVAGNGVESLMVKPPATILSEERTTQRIPSDDVKEDRRTGLPAKDMALESKLRMVGKKQQVTAAAAAAKKPAKASRPLNLKPIESGLYRPNTTHTLEHYAGAWLVPKRRLLEAKLRIQHIKSLEGASFSVSGYAAHQDHRITLMTRDYFDFAVQHLSSTTNQLPQFTTQALLDELLQQTTDWVDVLRSRAEGNLASARIAFPSTPPIAPYTLSF